MQIELASYRGSLTNQGLKFWTFIILGAVVLCRLSLATSA